jgi:hypothetical protein
LFVVGDRSSVVGEIRPACRIGSLRLVIPCLDSVPSFPHRRRCRRRGKRTQRQPVLHAIQAMAQFHQLVLNLRYLLRECGLWVLFVHRIPHP